MPDKQEPNPKPPRSGAPVRPQYPTGSTRPRPRRQAQPTTAPSRENHVVEEDDDAVIVPAPAPSVFVAQRTKRADRAPNIFFRRTIIPILLTTAALLGALAALWFTLDPDEPMRIGGTRIWLPVTFLSISAVMLMLAILNMLQVRHLMRPGTR